MNGPRRPRFVYLRLMVLLLVVLSGAYLLAWVAGLAGTRSDESGERPLPTSVALTGLDAAGRPLSAYAAVDPALIPALEAANGLLAPDPLSVIAPEVPPIGIYLPATGSTQFELPAPTPTPAIAPLPTRTLTPTPTETPIPMPATFTPFVAPTLEGPPGYGGPNCAPAGWPGAGILTQRYSWYHRGIDIGIDLNSGVVATHSGEIIFAGWRTDGYGNLIILQNGQFITYYAHLNDFNVDVGQKVAKGNVIGWSGSTGNSTGPHIHYEIRINDVEVDPSTFESRGYTSC